MAAAVSADVDAASRLADRTENVRLELPSQLNAGDVEAVTATAPDRITETLLPCAEKGEGEVIATSTNSRITDESEIWIDRDDTFPRTVTLSPGI
jgi:hypothetical protein